MDPILQTIHAIYETVLDESAWETALEHVRDLTGSTGFNIFVLDRHQEVIPINRSIGIPDDVLRDYSNHYVQTDPGIAYYLRNPNKSFYYNYAHTPESEIDKSEYYSWLQSNGGARYYLATTFEFNDRYSAIVTAQRSADVGHAQAADMALLGQISPHLQRALELNELIQRSHARAETALDALERAPYGVLLLDQSGDVVFVNHRARAMLRTDNGLRVTGKRMVAACPQAHRRLQQAVGDCLRAATGESLFPGTSLPVPTQAYGRPCMLRIAPLIGPSRLLTGERPSVMVVVTDLNATPDDLQRRNDSLIGLYGLTPAEAAVAVLLGDALRPAEICRQRGISPNTLKTHRRHIFEKVGVETQAALSRIVARL